MNWSYHSDHSIAVLAPVISRIMSMTQPPSRSRCCRLFRPNS